MSTLAPQPPHENVESLKRRYTQLERNHKEWQEQAQKDLRRQKLEIDALKRDNEQFKQELNELRVTEVTTAVGVGSLRNPHSKSTKRTNELESKRDTLAHLEMRSRQETNRIRDIERQINETRGMIRMARRTLGGVNVTQDSCDSINRQIAVLENRLHQSLVNFNEALRQNKDLRDHIDTLRGERDVFKAIYEKLEAELQEKKKEMAFIIEVSNIAYEERDNNVQVLANLRAFAAEEMQSFAETFKELDDLLEEDRKMKENVKARLAALQKKDAGEEASDRLGSSSKRRPKTAPSGKAQATPTRLDAKDAVSSQLQAYEEAFLKIRQATDIPDLGELVQRFLHSEEDNFSLFSYVNDLGKEIERLEKERGEILQQIEKISSGDEADQQRRAKLSALEASLRTEEQKAQHYAEMSQKTEAVLRGVMTAVESTFSKLDCDESLILETHGVGGLTMETILPHLATIELRTEELLAGWVKQSGAAEGGLVINRGPQVPFETLQVPVDIKRLPGTGDDADGSEEDDHPLSREELQRKAQKKLNAQALAATERRVKGAKPKVGIAAATKKQ